MLQAIREKAQGWIAWAIVILISIPFALWGIQEYLGVGAEPEVAVVDGEKITQRMLDERTRDFRENMRQTLGDAYRADLFDDNTLKRQVRDAMVEEMVLVKSAHDWNLRTADGQARAFIASIQAFQRDGRFDQTLYEAAVRNRGMTAAGFEQSVRQDLAVGQLRSGIRDSAFVTDAELQTAVRLSKQQREITQLRIPAEQYRSQVVVTPEALRAFYDANQDRYRTPERVKLAYVLLDAAGVGEFVEVNEEALRTYFDNHRAEFVAREERAMRHILVALKPGAAESEVQAAESKAADLLARIRAGDDFAAIAKENSDDPGSADNGGDLGWVERGLMVPPFEQAAFALAKGAVSDLVRTDFGFHIIQVTDLRGGSAAGFEQMRDKVEAAYRKFEGENLYFDYAERLAESAYESPDSLTPASEALGLPVQESEWLTRDGLLSGPLGSPRVSNAAFSDDVLIEGNNSELIEIGEQRAVVVRVLEHEPAGVKAFDTTREQIEADFVDDKASKAAAQAGAEAIARLVAGEGSLKALAGSSGWELSPTVTATRESMELSADVLAEAFSVKPPVVGETAYTGVSSAQGDFLLIGVGNVKGGDLATLAESDVSAIAEQSTQRLADGQLRYFTRSLRDRTPVELKPIGE